jgi:transcription termination/antitermination factor NusG
MGFEQVEVNVDYNINDTVRIMDGPLTDFTGTVTEINKEKHKVKVLVSMFGRETPVELEFSQVQKI